MQEKYLHLLEWLNANQKLGFWLVFFLFALVLLFVLYLLYKNFQLQIRLRKTLQDNARLMQEKDLMREGIFSQRSVAPDKKDNDSQKGGSPQA